MKPIPNALIAAFMLISSSVMAGDVAQGKEAYVAKGCLGCHGPAGISRSPLYPSLTGKAEAFVQQNLREYRSGKRLNPIMNGMAAELTDAEIDNLAAYVGTL